MYLKSVFFTVCVLFIFSCTKNNSSGSNRPLVYTGGLTGTPGFSTQGVVWIGDSVNNFANSSGIASVALSGFDFYALSGNTYWKNGVAVSIPDIRISKQIVVAGIDVYIAGSSLTSDNSATAAAVYWKNGTLVNLTANLTNVVAAFTNGIAISGGDVYVCGYLFTGYNDTLDAVYWKNGDLNYLPNGYMAKCIAVSGSNVYIGGTSIHNGDVYWINGQLQSLGNNAWVNAITASGPDVYIAGFTVLAGDEGCYWKNGQQFPLPGNNGATGISIHGSDVYCSGNTNSNYAAYWKNGIADTLAPGAASSIVVQP
jgi:hypothetical protein